MNNSNPFEFKYPDDIEPSDVIDLFVPVFGEYYNIPISGHTFINGPRGSGKSMMFRYMKPDCQSLINADGQRLEVPKNMTELSYFSIYLPIKKGHLNITDIQLNNRHGETLLNEHFMVVQFSLMIFNELSETKFSETDLGLKKLSEFFNQTFKPLLKYSGFIVNENYDDLTKNNYREIFLIIIQILREISSIFQHDYIKKLIGASSPIPYNGPILLYTDFLYEILKSIKALPFMPNKPIYLLIDDADELNLIQRKILNSWVSLRTSKDVSLKISTQLKYRIFSTINDSRIDTPHDYSEVNLNDIYTTKKDIYYKRIHEIISKRLIKFHFAITDPELFFPPDKEQEKKIEEKRNNYMESRKKAGDNYDQAFSYAYRYVVPDFIKELQGNRYTFSYAGFKQLVNVSSGIIREFIDFSSEMFESQKAENHDKEINFISDKIQNREIIRYSDKKIDSEFDKFRDEASNKGDMDKLRNLIMGMGGLFRLILHSAASERRVFSIALNTEPDDELKNILDIGVQLGYLQKSMIGNKTGTGKSRLYILNRTLAPHFGLDPANFAGYKFMPSETLKISLVDDKKFIDTVRKTIKGETDNKDQATLFPDND